MAIIKSVKSEHSGDEYTEAEKASRQKLADWKGRKAVAEQKQTPKRVRREWVEVV